jgi:hypothetical protein
MLTWCRKKSRLNYLNSADPVDGFICDEFGGRVEFQVSSGKLKSRVIRTFS